MTAMTRSLRLLAGPDFATGAEWYAAHAARLGELPVQAARQDLVSSLERSGLLGRGGAGFPVGRKWRAVAERARRGAVVVANGAEGEPRSSKDQALMALRPHLVIDGAVLAALAVGADELVLYVGSDHHQALTTMHAALRERPMPDGLAARVVEAPASYVSGESTAVVHYLNDRDARPTDGPPRPFERGVGGRPTLVQNVESLAYAALIARFGDRWYSEAGRAETPGTALVTVTGPLTAPGVREIEYGTSLREVIESAGGRIGDLQAALLGGYFGGWASLEDVLDVPLDPQRLAKRGLGFGCGLIGLLESDACGVVATEQIVSYMAAESARQCGPCLFGLGAMAWAMRRLASGSAQADDVANLDRWSTEIVGRGACHHPDGAAALVRSALDVFAPEFVLHQSGRCLRRSAVVERSA
ncbi:MAG: proton-conducting membrane transporter [Chloroflexota bacterium]|nr:proton-conducting membrane transporter [Chloroflexota bacterium]